MQMQAFQAQIGGKKSLKKATFIFSLKWTQMPKKELRITINYILIKGLQTSPFIQFQSAVALSQSYKALENPTCYQTLETKASSKKTEVNSVSCVAKSFLHALPVGINCIFTCNLERTYQIMGVKMQDYGNILGLI